MYERSIVRKRYTYIVSKDSVKCTAHLGFELNGYTVYTFLAHSLRVIKTRSWSSTREPRQPERRRDEKLILVATLNRTTSSGRLMAYVICERLRRCRRVLLVWQGICILDVEFERVAVVPGVDERSKRVGSLSSPVRCANHARRIQDGNRLS